MQYKNSQLNMPKSGNKEEDLVVIQEEERKTKNRNIRDLRRNAIDRPYESIHIILIFLVKISETKIVQEEK